MEKYLCFRTYEEYYSTTEALISIEKKTFTWLKIAFQETAQEYFWARNWTMC